MIYSSTMQSIYSHSNNLLQQGSTNDRCHFTMATKFCRLSPNVCVSSARNFFSAMVLAPESLKCLLDIWNNCAPLLWSSSFPVQKHDFQSYARNFSQINDFRNVNTHFSSKTDYVKTSTTWQIN